MDSNKQKFLEFVSKAYDKGFVISVASYSSRVSEEEAIKLAAELSHILNLPVHKRNFGSSKGYEVGDHVSQIQGTFFYGPANFLEEDVDLSGGDDEKEEIKN